MLTKAFKQIDLDALPCPRIERRIRENAQLPRGLRPHEERRYRFVGSSQWKTLGFKPESLFDWRALERRWHQLRTVVQQTSEALWDAYRSFSRISAESGGGGEVWLPCPDGEFVDTYQVDERTGDGRMGCEPAKRLFDRAVLDPGFKPYVVLGEDLDRMHSCKRRVNTMRRRSCAYWTAFRVSVEDRLGAYAQRKENRLPFDRERYCNPCAFVFTNDDRAYLVTSSESGSLTWHDNVDVHVDGLTAT